jgi:hypothetical protein
MRIYYRGQMDQKGFLKVLGLHNMLGKRRWILTGGGIMLLVSALVVSMREPGLLSAMLPGLIFMMVFLSFPWWVPYVQANAMTKNGIYSQQVSGIISDEEVTINGAGSKSTFEWSAYSGYKMKDDLILLYQGKNNFNIFPKAFFHREEDWDEFVRFVKEKVKML